MAYCATGERWAVLDLERLIAEGRGDYRFVVRARTEIRKLVGDVTMRPDGGVLDAEIDRARVAGALLAVRDACSCSVLWQNCGKTVVRKKAGTLASAGAVIVPLFNRLELLGCSATSSAAAHRR